MHGIIYLINFKIEITLKGTKQKWKKFLTPEGGEANNTSNYSFKNGANSKRWKYFSNFLCHPTKYFLKIVAKMFKLHLLTVGISATPLDIYVATMLGNVSQEVSTFIFFWMSCKILE
jgi:hypothetical protein